MALFNRCAGRAFRAEPLSEKIAVELADLRLAVAPGHFRAGLMVHEVIQPEGKTDVAVELDDLIEAVAIFRLAVGSQTHDLVLIAVIPETQVLGQRRVIDAEGMRKGDGTLNVDR